MIQIKRWNRCTWLLIIACLLEVIGIGLFIPGLIGITGANHYHDFIFYMGLSFMFFGTLFFVGWWICQYELDPDEDEKYEVANSKSNPFQIVVTIFCKSLKAIANWDELIQQLFDGCVASSLNSVQHSGKRKQ